MRGWIFLVFKDVLHVVFNYSIVSSRVDSFLTQNYHFELKTEQNLSLETNTFMAKPPNYAVGVHLNIICFS